jgi:hypothetical protein
MADLARVVADAAAASGFSGVGRVDRVSIRSEHDPERALTWTVASNTTDGAWPLAGALEACLG